MVAIARLKTHVSGAGQMFWFLKRSWTLNPFWGWFLLLTVTILRVLRGNHDVSRLEDITIIRPVPWFSHAASCTMPWWIEDRPGPDSQSQLTTGCIRMHSRQLLVILQDTSWYFIRSYCIEYIRSNMISHSFPDLDGETQQPLVNH